MEEFIKWNENYKLTINQEIIQKLLLNLKNEKNIELIKNEKYEY